MLNYAEFINLSLWQVLEIIFIGEHWKMGRKRQQPGMLTKYRKVALKSFTKIPSHSEISSQKRGVIDKREGGLGDCSNP